MKRNILVFMAIAAIICLAAPQAFAVGFGFYGSAGTGSADWDEDYFFSGSTQKFSTDSQHKSFGVTLDTGLAGERFFNYHLNIGREWFTSKNFIARDDSGTPSAGAGDIELKGMMMSHTFGFGAEISDSVRMWLGPELRWYLGLKGSPENAPMFELDGVGFGFGPSLGLNFNFPSGLTLMVKAGYIMTNYALDAEGYIGTPLDTAYNSYDVDETFTYINFEFLFRTPSDR